jgi:hypothetical protein
MLSKFLGAIRHLWAMRSHRAYAAWMDRDFRRWQRDRSPRP